MKDKHTVIIKLGLAEYMMLAAAILLISRIVAHTLSK